MTTTLEVFTKYAQRNGNYGSLPKLDVEILVGQPRIDTETSEVLTSKHDSRGFAEYFRSDGSKSYTYSFECYYCGTTEPGVVRYLQHAWYDAKECSRCKGVSGWSIGD